MQSALPYIKRVGKWLVSFMSHFSLDSKRVICCLWLKSYSQPQLALSIVLSRATWAANAHKSAIKSRSHFGIVHCCVHDLKNTHNLTQMVVISCEFELSIFKSINIKYGTEMHNRFLIAFTFNILFFVEPSWVCEYVFEIISHIFPVNTSIQESHYYY